MATTDFPRVLLAKPPGKSAVASRHTLRGHLGYVLEVANVLTEATGRAALVSMGLPAERVTELRSALMRGCFLHDLGKANSQFQRMMLAPGRGQQALWHEYISAWLPLKFPHLGNWLFKECSETVHQAAMFAALGHHLRLEDGSSLRPREGSGDTRVAIFCDHRDFKSCLVLAAELIGLGGDTPRFPRLEADLLVSRPLPELNEWMSEAYDWFHGSTPGDQQFVALVKAMLIAADVAGSAVPRAGNDPGPWAAEVLGRVCGADELEAVAQANLGAKPTRPFQDRIASSQSGVTFAKAGCGSGKTVAAYMWAARRAAGRKLFFCYPTTGTATEGFKDYIIPGEMAADAALLHSRAEYDLEEVPISEGDALERNSRLESMRAWDVPLVICTVDQVLGIIQNGRRPLFGFPAIANGAFVFDEVHQYDERLFGALLRFLNAFRGAPVLLMTASLPSERVEALTRVMAERGEPLEVIEGPADLENLQRYRLVGPVDEAPWEQVRSVLGKGGKVLWVSNTVDRCVSFAKEGDSLGLHPLPYHSRYRYCDRVRRHRDVIEGFKGSSAVLAVTTQVCEVSLDISADLLVTDLAPIPALIQRMGRLNRRVTPDEPGQPGSAIVLVPDTHLPYDKPDLELARSWLTHLGPGHAVSQADLARAFDDVTHGKAPSAIASAWLDGGPFSRQAPLREGEMTVPIVRADDLPSCIGADGRPVNKEVTRYSIPMTLGPVAREIRGWKALGYAFVAPQGRVDYSEFWGARWLKQ